MSIKYSLKQSYGFSLIEVMISLSISIISILIIMQMNLEQMKANNYLEFQIKKTSLTNNIIGQFLSQPMNCRCLFQGANTFPTSGTSKLTGTSPTELGTFQLINANNCNGATIPVPLINANGVDWLSSSEIALENIRNTNGNFYGDFIVRLKYLKPTVGTGDSVISIPVAVDASVSGGNATFSGCSAFSNATIETFKYIPNTPTIACNLSNSNAPDNLCPITENVLPNGTWYTFDLKPYGVPSTAKHVTIRILNIEAKIYVKKNGNPDNPLPRNLLAYSKNDSGNINDAIVDVDGANGVIRIYFEDIDPPTWGARIHIVGYQ